MRGPIPLLDKLMNKTISWDDATDGSACDSLGAPTRVVAVTTPQPVVRVMFLTSRLWVYAVIALFLGGLAAFLIVPSITPTYARWPLIGCVVPLLSLIFWTVSRELVVHVTAGSDGVLIGELNRRRFLSYASIAALIEEPNRMTFVLHSGDHAKVTTHRARHAFRRRHAARADALVARIRRGVDDHAPELASSEATPNALLLRVQALLSEGASRDDAYRDNPLPDRSALLSLVADGTKAQKSRAAAAAALRTDAEARARISIIAAETASPTLAAVFAEVVAEADESRVLAVLEDVGNDDYEPPISGSS